ncbi:hypothetical protein SPRG_05352 [Saprolegnia parasitica CBS 223.65]|uniref:Calx-beta domain-containing protein n=1 Tax=Saprolegnia parasitica (strain CBS 223.65) TaxID=695850 RepID=A0A067CLT5_SAPPC|nr:hypothetical protein SPRG_05352 [Saprolegnia parasitica CBS 223.65]KDO30160.1 hypothetical protein SPRG_05352 [Saprolegnia parasitica CBS 223.65]|eukprot:XP_012199338.1 hypothetical protein SPRG_05352 [Saprolegnia parasitica CBS 223.65]
MDDRRAWQLVRWMLLLLALSTFVSSNELVLISQPVATAAGNELSPPPTLQLEDGAGTVLHHVNSGFVSVYISTNPRLYAHLSSASGLAFPIVGGVITCTGLSIDLVATGYTLTFVSLSFGVQTTSNPFNILLGLPHTIALTTALGATTGGSPFAPQPSVSIVDKGGNVVHSVSAGTVSVAIGSNPVGGILTPPSAQIATFSHGVATFQKLQIDRTGGPYTLIFTCDATLLLPGGSSLTTRPFVVATGPPTQMAIVAHPLSAFGGQAFMVQPTLQLLDAGGNLLSTEPKMLVTAAIYANPSGGRLYPTLETNASVVHGVASFKNLRIDAAGPGYVLRFAVISHNLTYDMYSETGLFVLGPSFTVYVGALFSLQVVQSPSNHALADGQPFTDQPIVALKDRGNNTLRSENAALVSVAMVPSLAVYSTLVVSTANSPIAVVTNVFLLPSPFSSPHGAGTLLLLNVTFSQQVRATGDIVLQLNSALGAVATCDTLLTWSTTLTFRYEIAAGDTSAALNYASTSALVVAPGATLQDRLGVPPVLALPMAGLHPIASVDTTAPVIVSMGCAPPTVAGTYGPGQTLQLLVTFSLPVAVRGVNMPYLSLNTGQTAGFHSGNNTARLVFHTAALDVTTSLNANGALLRRAGTALTQDASVLLPTAAAMRLPMQCALVLSSAAPAVDPTVGVTSTTANGVYAAGDPILLQVTFTAPVDVSGVPRLLLNTMQYASYVSGSGSTVLSFQYIVQPEDNVPTLDYASSAALVRNGGDLVRHVTAGTALLACNVDLSAATANGRNLGATASLTLHGLAPVVTTVAWPTTPSTYVRGTTVALSVTFSFPVVVADGIPSIALSNGGSATYTSGSGTSTLVFEYTVALGDATSALSYVPWATIALRGSTIRQRSSSPMQPAQLSLPWPAAIANGPIALDPTIGHVTTVVSISADQIAGEYGENHAFAISVVFSDAVFVTGSVQLALNTRSVAYATGSGSSTLMFLYTVQPLDATASLSLGAVSPLSCTGGGPCSLLNANNVAVDGDCTSVSLQPVNIAISTVAPVVLSVSALTPAPLINRGTFIVGDVVQILVVASKPVDVQTSPTALPHGVPTLLLNTGRAAFFVGYHNGDRTQLLFEYTVMAGDATPALRYTNTSALTLNYNRGSILRLATTPTTPMNLALPPVANLGLNLVVDTTRTPLVTDVAAVTPNGAYYVGDVIQIQVTFSETVAVTGVPVLLLDLGLYDRRAIYVSGTASTVLVFRYTIEQDDVSTDLSYLDSKSLYCPPGARIRFMQASFIHKTRATVPTVPANCLLPLPGVAGSLSANSNVEIRGTTPYITDISFLSPNATYVVGSTIDVQVTLSAAVVTAGAPFLRMASGPSQRQAFLVPSAGASSRLLFRYTVQTGDRSGALDYADTQALQLNGGTILTAPTLPASVATQYVNVHLNPPGGTLFGGRVFQAVAGVASFLELGISTIGRGYQLVFASSTGAVTKTLIDVSYSAVYEVRNAPLSALNRGDRTGASVAVTNGVAVVGSPGAKVAEYNVQVVTATGSATAFVNEVQYVMTSCIHRDAVQVLTTSAAPGETVGGYFSLLLGPVGPSRRIASDYDATQLKVALELDFGYPLGSIDVTRSPNTFCGCWNAFAWTITFRVPGDIPTLFARNFLSGAGATVGDGRGGALATVLVPPAVVSGAFALRYGSLVTQDLASDIDAPTLATRLSMDLNLPVLRIARSAPTPQSGYTWSITFDATATLFNPNPLQPAPVLLAGNQALLAVRTVREGSAPLSGSFQLSLGGYATPNIPVTASTAAMETALLTLPVVSAVSVGRSGPNAFGGYAWTVTFLKVNLMTTYGLVLNSLGTLPPLVPTTQLHGSPLLVGSSATILVEYAGVNPSASSAVAYGNTPGQSAGSATVFVPKNQHWVATSVLVGDDTQLGDQFGASVAVNVAGTQIVVGAPYAVDRGHKEVQTLLCTADGGTFTLAFLGMTSAPISFAASAATLQATLAALLNVPERLLSVAAYTALCNGVGVAITFSTPDLSDAEGNLPNLVADGTQLTSGGGPGTVTVLETTVGSFRLDGARAKGVTCGGAYFFVSDSTGAWTQVAKFTPTSDSGASASELGASASIETNLAVVGAPGASSSIGEVYVYEYNGVTWSQIQILTSAPYAGEKGDRFGDTVAISGARIVVGAPGYGGGLGAVFVYVRVNGVFIAHETIQAADLQLGDGFGSALDLDMTTSTLVVGTAAQSSAVGAVYIYTLPDMYFTLQQKVSASNARANDGFGHSVAVAQNVLLVGANAKYGFSTPRTVRKAVQTITTSAATPIQAGSTFRVGYHQSRRGHATDYIYSPPIPFDVSAVALQTTLQASLQTGALVVQRLGPDANGGCTWYITFAGATGNVHKLRVDGSKLVGSSARIAASVLVAVPPIVRSDVYVFVRSGASWTEQATLRPTHKQFFRCFFWGAVAMARTGANAIVGAPNADTRFSHVNSGAGYIFDLGFLDVALSSPVYSVLEGASVSVPIQRCGPLGLACKLTPITTARYINVDTGDAISDLAGANFVPARQRKYIGPFQQLAMLDVTASTPGAAYYPNVNGPEPYPQVPSGRYLRRSWVGTANSRAQFYGSPETRSRWVDAQFDYQGLSDYTPTNVALLFPPNNVSASIVVPTTDDMVFESPDETINVRLSVPGMWPSYPSQFWSQITILDNGDGGFGTTSYTAMLSGSAPSRLGSAIALLDGGSLAALGAPTQFDPTSQTVCGAVFVYRATSGIWAVEATLRPPTCSEGLAFGTSLAIDASYGTTRLVVGAPSGPSPAAFVYTRNSALGMWTLETQLGEPTAVSVNTKYAAANAVAIHGYHIVVGAAGLECTFLYTLIANTWQPAIVLRASDYATDLVYLQNVVHEFGFGASVALAPRTLVVGAPLAKYGPTRVDDAAYLGTGAAYVYYLPAQVQQVTLRADKPLTAGHFVLSIGAASTALLSYEIAAVDLAAALEKLLPKVHVVRTGSIVKGFTWTVTMLSEVTTVPTFVVTWNGHGCISCTPLNSGYAANPAGQITVATIAPLGTWTFHQQLAAADGNHADRFGSDVDIDGDSIIVGAYGSSALVTTTWNFETGDLTGWVQTGNAFLQQPTFGENRQGLGVIGFEGRYWLGTYEARPGAGQSENPTPFSCGFLNGDCAANQNAVPGTAIAGTVQGDGPQGTLTSQPFSIRGSRIRFRIGGGCTFRTVYVELLIDGISVQKSTGRCSERLHSVTWTVSQYMNRTAQIRIVDASESAFWGHINVDAFDFDWPIEQATTELAGVAYVFYRSTSSTAYGVCRGVPKLQCAWMLQARLVASDKRDHDMFGFSVSIDDVNGTAIVGAYGQAGVNLNNSIVGEPATGSIYVYSRIPAERDALGNVLLPPRWPGRETAKLQAVNKAAGAQFGYAVSVTMGHVAVGSPGAAAVNNIGLGYIFNTQFLQVSVAAKEVGVKENDVNGHAIVMLLRAGNSTAPLTIEYATSDLDARGVDALRFAQCLRMLIPNREQCGKYQQTSGEVTFAAGVTSIAIPVPIMNDNCYTEGESYVAVHLNVPGGDVLLGEQFSMRIRIDDDDFGQPLCP